MGRTLGSEAVEDWLASGTDTEPRTQTSLAALIGARVGRDVAQSTISAIVRGASTPRGDLISAFNAVIGIGVEEWTLPPTRAPISSRRAVIDSSDEPEAA